jgi:glyceraldehyde-3-phosphate dehydrogenase/erythrose-4-phosphate dehydrogenase
MAGIAINGRGRVGRTALKIIEQAAGEVNDAFREEAASDRYRGILGVADDPVVVKVMSWYDNEWGFTSQMTREAFTALGLPAPDLAQVRP